MSLPQLVAEDRMEFHLANWAAWQRGSGMNLWYPSRASGGIGKTGSSDFDAMCATADAHCAHAVDTLIDDLPPRERMTIYNTWLATVFIYRGCDDVMTVADLYIRGKERIAKGLEQRGIW